MINRAKIYLLNMIQPYNASSLINKNMEFILNKKGDHSLGPDQYTGWKMNLTAENFHQFPLYFTNQPIDNVSKTLTSFGSRQPFRVVYMGPRHSSNFKAFKNYSRSFEQEQTTCQYQGEIYRQPIQKFQFRYVKEKEKVFPIRAQEYRLFSGMNPTVKRDDLRFDSNFQCGNLDLAISINPFQYDLFMRVDSNTKGHTTWFFFRVANFSNKQKVKFNITNFQKNGLLYKQGMRVYCYRSSQKQWIQQGLNVQYKSRKLRYTIQSDCEPVQMNCLSFIYQFNTQDEYVYFSYGIPYTYSYLIHQINAFQKENPHFVQIDRSFVSTGGLQIPILTITNSNKEVEKSCCLAIGRLHPGQTQGSWMMDGFMKFLNSPESFYLRQKFIFIIIPMMNVDGVVLGNFRTGIAGRDLNRVFDTPQNYKEINLIRSIAQQFNPIIFLDFHGHSAKRNVFTYGPDYGVDNKHYITSRLLPKFISKLTNAFRYYSCSFRISKSKINTGRSIMLKKHNVAFSFTIQASSHSYGPRATQIIFNEKQFKKVGEKIAQGLEKFIKILLILPKRLQTKKQTQQKNQKQGKSKSPASGKKSPAKIRSGNKMRQILTNQDFDLRKMQQLLGQEDKGLFQELLNDQKQREQQQGQLNSDEQDSDYQEGFDYTEKEMNRLMNNETDDSSSIEKRKKNKKKRLSSNETFKIKSSIYETDQLVIRKKPKGKRLASNHNNEGLSTKINTINYLKKSVKLVGKIDQTLPMITNRNQSNLSVFQHKESLDESMNKVYYNNWKRQLSPMEKLQKKYKKANSSLNHINLDYSSSLPKQEELEADSIKKVKQYRQSYLKKKLKKDKQQQKIDEKIVRNYSLKNHLQDLNSRQILLPLIFKNKSVDMNSHSVIQEIMTKHENVQKKYIRKNLKIFYF